jgi:xanthine/uracil permease
MLTTYECSVCGMRDRAQFEQAICTPVSAGRDRVSEIARWRGPTISEFQAMASPTYGLDVVALAFAVVLAAALVLLISHLMPLLADVMPPVLSVDPG